MSTLKHSNNGTEPVRPDAAEVAAAAERHAQALEAQAAEVRFHARYIKPLFTIADALKPQPPEDWIIDGIAEAGGVFGLFGKPGSKKTYVMLTMAMCVALGEPWLDRPTKQCKVLWIDEDSGRKRLLRRLNKVANGAGANSDTPFSVLSLAGVNVLDPQGALDLHRLIATQEPGLVVIDTLADIIGGAKVVSPDEMQPVLQTLRRIAEQTNTTIAFIHHTNKAGDFLGAINIAGKCDLLLQAESKPGSELVTFTAAKVRDTGDVKFAGNVCFYEDSIFMTAADMDGIERAKRIAEIGGAAKHVYEYLRERKSGTVGDMADELHSQSAIKKAVQRLKDAGILERIDSHVKGLTATYAIASNSAETRGG